MSRTAAISLGVNISVPNSHLKLFESHKPNTHVPKSHSRYLSVLMELSLKVGGNCSPYILKKK